jgi:hypothetical protein
MRSSVSFSALLRGMVIPVLVFLLSLVVARGAAAVDDAAARPVAATAPVGIPVAVSGAVIGLNEVGLVVRETGSDTAVAFPVIDAEGLTVTRGGDPVAVGELRPGDAVSMAIDGLTGRVLRVDAQAAPGTRFAPSNEVGLLASLGLVGGAGLLATRLRRPQPLTAATTTNRHGCRLPVAAPTFLPGQQSLARVLEAPRRLARVAVRF